MIAMNSVVVMTRRGSSGGLGGAMSALVSVVARPSGERGAVDGGASVIGLAAL
jgi:hypothetical protein